MLVSLSAPKRLGALRMRQALIDALHLQAAHLVADVDQRRVVEVLAGLGDHSAVGHDLHGGAHGAPRGRHHEVVVHVDLRTPLTGLGEGGEW